ncbi:glucocorticoid receptor-like (DNA-binding domain) [Gymnopus androsaceus JB14]|uniref:Glucocorticoid receptor-like (DNA-binding domain) n=1 Tax=Gymnopus androsaceus JB14 TaxID=1447944 RepID=A0A6A4GQV4_9AGAR|nr:glucocorticoid receptor-like (DNA-binding domain) [Gymnopus androsaceus JB14]
MFAFDLDFTGQLQLQAHPRSYSSASSSQSSSASWIYASSSQNGALEYGESSQRHSRPWLEDSVADQGSLSFPRSVTPFHSSRSNTDLQQLPIYNSSLDVWTTSQLPSHWPESDTSWSNTYETKPIIHHCLPTGSCSPFSTISPPSASPPPIQQATDPDIVKAVQSVGTNRPRKMCSHCHTTSTPLWRREPSTLRTLCNACGLYLQQRSKLRPQELINAGLDDESESSEQDSTGPECSHCHTRNTSVWRRSKTGTQLCNACGVYARLRGKDRPLSLKQSKIKHRTRHSKRSGK